MDSGTENRINAPMAKMESYLPPQQELASRHYFQQGMIGEISDEIKKLRAEYANIFKELNVDLVLSGHDHIYSRSYLINGETPATDTERNIKNVGETLYITAGSASGNMFYSRERGKTEYTAYMDTRDKSFATRVDVDQNQISIKTFHAQTKELLEEYVLQKN